MKRRKGRFWTLAVVVAAVILLALVALVALGVLVLPGIGSAPALQVTEVQFTVLQGATVAGVGWFGPTSFTMSGASNGYPLQVPAGANFTVAVPLNNFDSSAHTIFSAQSGAPFTFLGSSPTFPLTVAPGDEVLFLTYGTPSTPGASLPLYITLNAEPP